MAPQSGSLPVDLSTADTDALPLVCWLTVAAQPSPATCCSAGPAGGSRTYTGQGQVKTNPSPC